MIDSGPYWLGHSAAEKERQGFGQQFFEPNEIASLLSDDIMIISGSKGSGKTAIRQGIEQLHRDQYSALAAIELDSMTFSQSFSEIEQIYRSTKLSPDEIARNVWKHVFVVYALKALYTAPHADEPLKRAIARIGATDGGAVMSVPNHELFNTWLEKLWMVITTTKDVDARVLPAAGLSPRQLAAARTFPITEDFRNDVEPIFQLIAARGKPIMIMVDGLDSVTSIALEADPSQLSEAKDCLFAGMFDAAYKLISEPLLAGMIRFKLLVPQERADAVYRLRDVDKVKPTFSTISWSPTTLQEFVRRRLIRLNGGIVHKPRFEDVWHQVMPESVSSENQAIDERSFPYILRNTLFRPRQVLEHLNRLFKAWHQRRGRSRVDPSFIPNCVAETNRELCEFLVSELREDIPAIEDFLKSLSGSPDIIAFGELSERVTRLLGANTQEKQDRALCLLYNAGLFGLSERCGLHYCRGELTPLSTNRSHSVQTEKEQFVFTFRTGRPERKLYFRMNHQQDCPIAFAPMLRQYCSLTPARKYVLI